MTYKKGVRPGRKMATFFRRAVHPDPGASRKKIEKNFLSPFHVLLRWQMRPDAGSVAH